MPTVGLRLISARSQHADYPAVLPYRRSRDLYDHGIAPEERVVRGTLVKGLEKADIELLDIFEGDVRDWFPSAGIYPDQYPRNTPERISPHTLLLPSSRSRHPRAPRPYRWVRLLPSLLSMSSARPSQHRRTYGPNLYPSSRPPSGNMPTSCAIVHTSGSARTLTVTRTTSRSIGAVQ